MRYETRLFNRAAQAPKPVRSDCAAIGAEADREIAALLAALKASRDFLMRDYLIGNSVAQAALVVVRAAIANAETE